MRAFIAVLIGVALHLTCSAPRVAAAGQVCGPDDSGSDAICSGTSTSVVQVGQYGSGSQASAGSRSATRYVPYSRLTTAPDGLACVTTGYVAEGTPPADAVPDDSQSHIEGAGGYSNLFANYPPCPEQPLQPGQPVPAITRALVAARAWETRVPLPRPKPSIAPGRAITGKLAFLDTGGSVVHTYTEETTFGPLRIDATGTYMISWGDGETSGPYAFEGEPWPEGQITHEYQRVGTYDVVVTERWTATWSVGGQSGVLRTLQTVGRIDDFPVEQIQAVLRR